MEGFKASAGPISAAFEPLKPVFQWIGDKVQALWGWFTDLLTPVKSTSAELQSAAAMGRRFGEALAEGLNMVMHPLDSLKSGVSWLLDKLGIVSKEAAKAKLPESVARQQPATVNADGKVMMPSGGFPSWGYGFAGMYDSGGYIPRGQFGIVGENGPEIVNGPANVTSRRNTAALAAVVAGMMGVAAAPAELPPLHPLALPAKGGEAMVSRAATVPPVQPLFPKGEFTVDEIEHTGAPDRLTIRARSADFRETLNTRREKSWHKTTVGDVVKEIASRHKLKMALGKELSDKHVEHIDQTNESDGSFLMRLARQYGAIASVKNGNLLFIRQGQGKSATGKPLPVITITRKDGDSHRFTLADRGAYTGVIASWLHTREPAKKESTTVKRKRRTKKQKKEPEAKQGDYLVGTDENVLVLNRTYANRGNAERAAKMQWERLQRGVASFSLQLAEGRADLYTEMPVKVSGFKQPIDDAEWTITTLTHTVSPDNGFTTSLELEVRIDDFEME